MPDETINGWGTWAKRVLHDLEQLDAGQKELNKENINIVVAARIQYQKNILGLIAALALLKNKSIAASLGNYINDKPLLEKAGFGEFAETIIGHPIRASALRLLSAP